MVSNVDGVAVPEQVGYPNDERPFYGYWKDDTALGAELATKIYVRKGLRRLENLNFEVVSSNADSLLIRVNIYDTDGYLSGPGTNKNEMDSDIRYTIKGSSGLRSVPLRPYSIFVEDDFFVSLELVQKYSKEPLQLVLRASYVEDGSYGRYASQDKWTLIADNSMAYSLETTAFLPEKKAARLQRKTKKLELSKPKVSGFAIFSGK